MAGAGEATTLRPGKGAGTVYVISPRNEGSGMAPTYRVERDRGSKEFPQQLAVLRERWPIAFPAEHEDVRPLAMGVAREVAGAMSWSLPYTLGVLTRWKMAAVYCQAVLSRDQRIGLDGSPAERVDAEAKDLATKQLAQLEARKAAKKAAETAAAAVVKPKVAHTRPTETPEQLRDRVRAGLLRRRAWGAVRHIAERSADLTGGRGDGGRPPEETPKT
jgi:sRNA-binding protein